MFNGLQVCGLSTAVSYGARLVKFNKFFDQESFHIFEIFVVNKIFNIF